MNGAEHSASYGILNQSQNERTNMLRQLIDNNHDKYGLLYQTVLHNHTQHVSSFKCCSRSFAILIDEDTLGCLSARWYRQRAPGVV
ncbi:hypothetical protein GQ53DRAFT_365391 [Thozetella sp. PMI_491]|nr:hypothetical protein GQ53DRAFT_365391 [Thozetella sp. PMI_491]